MYIDSYRLMFLLAMHIHCDDSFFFFFVDLSMYMCLFAGGQL